VRRWVAWVLTTTGLGPPASAQPGVGSFLGVAALSAGDGMVIDSVDPVRAAFAAGPHTGRWPDHLALAPNGSAWFTEYYGGRVARLP
jgi:hypothetical protein